MIKEAEVPPPIATTGGVIGGVPGGIPGGQLGGVIGGIVNATSSFAAVPKLSKSAPVVQRVRVSQGVTKGMVVYRIEPTYPPLARQARIQGVVVLTAMIDRDGNIQNLRLVSGHPMLAPAAIDAVKHWRYKPFLLNGQPVEVCSGRVSVNHSGTNTRMEIRMHCNMRDTIVAHVLCLCCPPLLKPMRASTAGTSPVLSIEPDGMRRFPHQSRSP